MADVKRYEDYGIPLLRQGGCVRTGADNDYIKYSDSFDPNYAYRICTLDYIPQHHPTQITITGIASKELDVSVLVLRSDNYIIASLGWQENGYTFNLGSNYDKLGVMFRFKNGDAITPNHVRFDEVEAWQHSLRKYDTSTDTLTTLPTDIYADGNNASVGLVGNMSQSDTPTPQSPIQPQECGDRTTQLFDGTIVLQDVGMDLNRYGFTITKAGTYTVNITGVIESNDYCYGRTYSNGEWSQFFYLTTGSTKYKYTVSISENEKLVIFNASGAQTEAQSKAKFDRWKIMANTGSTALPYEPYGYKIPISSANTTTPVYLGEVETTRQIKKLVLKGTEVWTSVAVTGGYAFMHSPASEIRDRSGANILSTHYKSQYANRDGNIYISSHIIVIVDFAFGNTSDFKAYLAQQYSAGTPVTIWYVLATPETAVVNEPIRKIGDYADEVSGITIPTTTGKDTFDVQTTLKPSEVSLSYTGWHDATVKEWDGSQWQ